MALKLLRKKTTKLKSFLREYSASLFLSPCPFIISTLGVAFQTDDHYVFAQEFAPAGDLFDIIPPQVRAVRTRTHAHTQRSQTYTHTRTHTHASTTNTQARTHTHMRAHTHTRKHACPHTQKNTPSPTHTNKYTDGHKQVCTQTHTNGHNTY